MRLLDLWEHVEEIPSDSRQKYYRLVTITWSRPRVWEPEDRRFTVPAGWAGHGGIYAFLRRHGNQNGEQIAYIGKKISVTAYLSPSAIMPDQSNPAIHAVYNPTVGKLFVTLTIGATVPVRALDEGIR
jgi:hypothetical protein